jgi:hypothetical protein
VALIMSNTVELVLVATLVVVGVVPYKRFKA